MPDELGKGLGKILVVEWDVGHRDDRTGKATAESAINCTLLRSENDELKSIDETLLDPLL